MVWTFVERGSSALDYFPEAPGPLHGKKLPTQMDVLKDYVFRGESGDALRAWLKLYPGDIKAHVVAISAAMKLKHPKAADLTLGEYVVWHGLFVAATVCVQRGHELWDASKASRRFRKHPEFGKFMQRNRLDAAASSSRSEAAVFACARVVCCAAAPSAAARQGPRPALSLLPSRSPSHKKKPSTQQARCSPSWIASS